MNRRFRSPALTALVALQFATSVAASAHAADKRACVVAYESAQQLRNQQKLRRAREQLAICAQSSCPPVITPDCSAWLKDVDAVIPTMIFRVRDERGRSLSDFRVTVDGDALSHDAETAASPFDPGLHAVRIEAEGFVAFEQKVALPGGEKGFVVEANLLPLQREQPPPRPREPVRELPKTEPRPEGKPPERKLPAPNRNDAPSASLGPAIYVAGGVSFLALTSFAFLGLQGTREADELKQSCAPGCSKVDVDAARTKLVAANVSLGVGIGTAVLAGVLFAFQPSSTPRSTSRTRLVAIDVRPSPHGGAEVSTTFSAP